MKNLEGQIVVESVERKKLRELEEVGEYVFHGTSADVDELEPRQTIDDATGPDDEPGIHASQIADYSIFMAVAAPLGRTRSGATVSDQIPTPVMNYAVSKDVMTRLTDDTNGWVYVFDRKDFKQRRPVEWICTKKTKPILKIKVSRQDLPRNIDIF